VLKPSENGFYMLSHSTSSRDSSTLDISLVVDSSLALIAHFDLALWHRRCGHISMQSLHAQHIHGVSSIPALLVSLKYVSCDSYVSCTRLVSPLAIHLRAMNHRDLS
jgi:hypothetical protein